MNKNYGGISNAWYAEETSRNDKITHKGNTDRTYCFQNKNSKPAVDNTLSNLIGITAVQKHEKYDLF